jgi:hypothetical protein
LFPFKDDSKLYESEALKAHGVGVISTIGQAVNGLYDLQSIVPVL